MVRFVADEAACAILDARARSEAIAAHRIAAEVPGASLGRSAPALARQAAIFFGARVAVVAEVPIVLQRVVAQPRREVAAPLLVTAIDRRRAGERFPLA
jgi:hypothetical protein